MFSYLAFCLVILVIGNAYSADPGKEPTVININQFFDEHLSDIRPLIKQFKFDPMPLPNISETVALVNSLVLTDGVMHGVSNLTRGGDNLISFYPDYWRFEAKVNVYELRCTFNYSIGNFFWQREGSLNASVKNVTASLSVDLSVPSFVAYNPKVHIEHHDLISVDLGKGSISDAVTNLVVNLALGFFQDRIIMLAESTASQVANVTVKMVNENVNKTIMNIDQYVGSLLARLQYTLVGDSKPQDVDQVFEPYLHNSTHVDPQKNPFRDLDQWLASAWRHTALVWNNSSGTQALYNPYGDLDKFWQSLGTANANRPKPTPPKAPQNAGYPGTTSTPSKRPHDFLSDFDRAKHEAWQEEYGNKTLLDVGRDIFLQSLHEVAQDYKKPTTKPSEWDLWWKKIASQSQQHTSSG